MEVPPQLNLDFIIIIKIANESRFILTYQGSYIH